jgi:MarR family transcriptional regulator, 2-MHQ and catechol-resistance regulon repressor
MASRYKGSVEEQAALDTYVKLMRAADSVTARLNRLLAELDLTASQFGALEALYHLGPLKQGEIGTKILKSSGNITMVVDNLERRGLVRRERESGDRRCVTVSLTDEGESLIAGIFPRHAASIVRELSVLNESEQRELGRLCRRLGLQDAELSA